MRAQLRIALAFAVAALAAVGASPAPAGTYGTASFACTPAVFDTLSALTGSGGARLGDDVPRKEKDTESFTGDPADPADLTAPGKSPKGAIPVYFHVVYSSDGTGDVSREVVRRQIDVLNITFGGMTTGHDTGFRFRLAGVDRTKNDAWFEQATLEAEVAMKSALKRGGSTELNIYSTSGGGFLGWSYQPKIVATKDAVLDGVVIHFGSMPGGEIGNYNLGYTTTHEVGHYLGLAHTFQKGCKAPGDRVDDTPFMLEPTSGCPADGTKDTCPKKPGLDPIHNYMDYSYDICYTEFTEGQAERMQKQYARWRLNNV
jgi:hypothetical protein